MRPLNRPMFRYGGPIKEGVMSGIREPKKDGNIVGGRQSPKLAGAHPLKDASGREHHFIPAGIAVGAGLNALRVAGMAAARRAIPKIANFFRTQTGTKTVPKQGPTFTMPGKTTFSKGYSGTIPGRTITPGTGQVPVYAPSYLGRDPTVRLVGGAYKAVTSPTSKGILGKGARLVFSPTGIATGLYFANGKFFNKDNIEVPPPPNADKLVLGDKVGTSGAPGGGDPNMFLTPKGAGSGVELSAEELRKKNVERYRDIMDIKGMNKEAAYDSLIAASQAINQAGGDLKGAIKDGSLLNQIIQSTSKAFDKPKRTKDAIDTLILKGEIEKDIKASDPTVQQKAKLTEKQIQIADKTLAGDSFLDIITERYKKSKVPRGEELAGILRATEGVDVTTIDSTKIPSGVDPQTFFESQIKESIKAGTPVNPGYYVISDRVLIVDAQGNVTPLL